MMIKAAGLNDFIPRSDKWSEMRTKVKSGRLFITAGMCLAAFLLSSYSLEAVVTAEPASEPLAKFREAQAEAAKDKAAVTERKEQIMKDDKEAAELVKEIEELSKLFEAKNAELEAIFDKDEVLAELQRKSEESKKKTVEAFVAVRRASAAAEKNGETDKNLK